MRGIPSKIRLLSTPVQLLTKSDLISIVTRNVGTGQVVVAHQNLHGAALLRRSAALQHFFETADYCSIDGMPLVWLARLCGFPAKREHRNTQLDWISDLLAALNAEGRTVFYVGGTEELSEKIRCHLKDTYPQISCHVHHGYLRDEDSASLRLRINAIVPDLIILGMGMPHQELWLLKNRHELRFGVALTSGAALEYRVGAQKIPMRLSGQLGLEWLIRLWNEPKRLGYRYLVEPWSLVFPALNDFWRYRFPANSGSAISEG